MSGEKHAPVKRLAIFRLGNCLAVGFNCGTFAMNVVDIITTTPHFSERELDILKHVALGMSAKEISKEIGLAPRTVERHVENIRMKLRAINSPHMVLCAIFYGVINMPKISDVLADHPILRL